MSGGGMSGEWLALAISILVPLSMRLIDYFLPQGRHFHVLDRWTVDNGESDN